MRMIHSAVIREKPLSRRPRKQSSKGSVKGNMLLIWQRQFGVFLVQSVSFLFSITISGDSAAYFFLKNNYAY